MDIIQSKSNSTVSRHEYCNLHALIRILLSNDANPYSMICLITCQIMKASFNYEKKIFHFLILFIVAIDKSYSEPKASNTNRTRQLNVEQTVIEILRTPKNPSKSTPIKW